MWWKVCRPPGRLRCAAASIEYPRRIRRGRRSKRPARPMPKLLSSNKNCAAGTRGRPGGSISQVKAIRSRLGGGYLALDRPLPGFFLGGSAESGYNLPGSVFDKEFRCTFDLLKSIPSARNPSISVTEDFFAFNTGEPYQDKAHILDRDGRIVHSPRFGLSMGDGLSLARVVLTPEAMLDGRRIEEFFSRQFFLTEFWFLWSTLMGSLPQHSVIEFRRYMNRFLYLFPDLSDMRGVMRTPVNQHQFFIEPLVAWLRPRGVNFLTDTFVRDIGFAAAPARTTVNRLDYEWRGTAASVEVALEDLVLVSTGSQAADLSAGSMTEVPSPRPSGRSWALWERLAQGRRDFGNPDVFFGTARIPDSLWVTFTVTDTGAEFVDQIAALTGSEAGLGGLVTLKDSGWVLSLSVFHQPEIIGQPRARAS